MSDTITNDAAAIETTATPKTKPARESARIGHSEAIVAYAKAKNVDTTKAGKLFRARLRSNFATIAKRDPKHYGANGTYKTSANDKRPWGDHSRAVLRELKLSK